MEQVNVNIGKHLMEPQGVFRLCEHENINIRKHLMELFGCVA